MFYCLPGVCPSSPALSILRPFLTLSGAFPMFCTRCGVISCSFQYRRLPRSDIRQRFPRAGWLSALYDFPRAAVHLRIAPAISARFRPSESIYTSGGCFSVSQIRGTFPAGWCGPAVLPAHLSPAPRICAAGCPLPDPAPVGLRCCPCTLWPFPSFLRGALFPLWLGFACMPVF